MVYRAHHEVASLWGAQIMEHMEMEGHRRALGEGHYIKGVQGNRSWEPSAEAVVRSCPLQGWKGLAPSYIAIFSSSPRPSYSPEYQGRSSVLWGGQLTSVFSLPFSFCNAWKMGSFYAPPGSVISRCFRLPVSCQDVGGCIFAALHQRVSFWFADCCFYYGAYCPLMNNAWATEPIYSF